MQKSGFSQSENCDSWSGNTECTKTRPAVTGQEDLSQTTVKVTMQSTSSLMNVLVTVSRIGAQINFVSAKDSTAILTVSARPKVARRVPGLLRQLVDVIDVSGL